MLQTRNKNISSEKKRKKKITVPRNLEEDISLDFFASMIVKDQFVILCPFLVVVNC